MAAAKTRTARRVVAGLAPILLVAAALPLLAPTCGGLAPGVKTFSKGSLIIPMDVCYQCSTDGEAATSPAACGQSSYVTPTGPGLAGGRACPQATDAGDVIKAYGLVYQLIRGGVAVYWIIDPAKTHVDDYDLTLSYGGGPPVQRYDWNLNGAGTAPTGGTSVSYMGGPFIVDGSDFAKASLILQANKSTFSTVKVHMANVAFQANVARTMAGGWTANATTPPKLALLDIGSSGAGSKNSEVVIRGYLIRAGLDFVGAGGTSAAGQHGQIYDRLTMADFLPSTPGDWTTTNLYRNGYQILWVPHWAAPSSCSDCTTSASTGNGTCPTTSCACNSKYSAQNVTDCLATIGSFYGAGHDVFSECAGLGSFEGVNSGTPPAITGTNATYGTGGTTTHFQTINTGSPANFGVWINKGVSNAATFQPGIYASPFMQIGDFVFKPYTGAIQNYRPTTYGGTVTRFLSETNDTTYDIFTVVPAVTSGHGTSVYLGGHSYSGCDGTFQSAGTRIVLNTLFNLGASCIASGLPCSTGLLGACAVGAMTCDVGGNQVCTQTVFPKAETCNGIDDDCNGLVDDGLTTGCYDGEDSTGPGNTVCHAADVTAGRCTTVGQPMGICRKGVKTCDKQADGSYAMSACTGQQLPAPEVCNGLDDNCNGYVDEDPTVLPTVKPLSQTCYDGPASTICTALDVTNGVCPIAGLPRTMCKRATQACTNGSFGACRICTAAEAAMATPPADCQILPLPAEFCGNDGTGNAVDDDCNGLVDEGCGCSSLPLPQQTRTCYTGPSGTLGIGPCHAGSQTCTSNAWGECSGQQLPVPEICGNAVDDDCNGTVDDPTICNVCPTPPTLAQCHTTPGAQGCCYDGPAPTLNVGVCRPGVRPCDQGVFGACEQQLLPSPELCNGLDDNCNGTVDEGASCGTGFQCVNGVCVFGQCAPEFPCPEGYQCAGISPTTGIGTCQVLGCGTGTCDPAKQCCTPGGCGSLPYRSCNAGLRCLNGACVDPCDNIKCAKPDVCAGGLCTGGSCYSTGCGSGQTCQNGQCATDPCASLSCPTGTFCRAGDCIQSCVYVSCAVGQRCGADGFCVGDPCHGVSCATGKACNASTGACEDNLCAGLSCGAGQLCDQGACKDDPCAAIDCPVGICFRGQCFSSANPTGAGTVSTTTEEAKKKASGCGCGSGEPSAALLLLGLLALPLARRRTGRSLRGLHALLLVGGLTGLLAGCPGGGGGGTKTTVDLSKCTETCGEQRCVDVGFDAAHCGTCDNACVAGQICVDGACGPASAVAPYIRGVSPGSAGKGSASVPIQVSGDRFQSGATLRIIHPPALDTVVSTTFTSSQLLQATIDLSAEPISTVYFRIVNPDHVISPVYPFQVVPVSPIVTAWTPSPLNVKVGPTPTTLHATGTGLTTASRCHIYASFTGLDVALPTSNQTGTALDCALDTSSMAPGAYDLWVVNDGLLSSAKVTLNVTTDALDLASLSPSTGAQGASTPPVSVTLYGTGFAASSVVQLCTTAGGGCTTWANQTTFYLDPSRLVGWLAIAGLPAGDYNVRVSNGGATSPVLPFHVIANPPSVSTVAFSPQPIYQNASEAVTVTGANFPATTQIQIIKPGATTPTTLSTSVTPVGCTSSCTATATLLLQPTSSWPTGGYSLLLNFPSIPSTSASFPFTVLSNVAVLSSITPAGDPQGTTGITLSLTGANFFSGMHVVLLGLGAAGVDLDLTASVSSATAATAGPFSLAGKDTGVYPVVARNTGAADSNSLGFSVTPGPPTLTSVTPSTIARSTACASPNPPPVVVTLAGTNFAKPDASGNGASTVVVSNTNLGYPASPLPTSVVQVSNSTTILVTVDTCSVYPGGDANPYTIQIWNPGGPTPPQKSNTQNVVFNP
jgi:MYXO-CTERM domain-containing protein